jgi:hypothetical protein
MPEIWQTIELARQQDGREDTEAFALVAPGLIARLVEILDGYVGHEPTLAEEADYVRRERRAEVLAEAKVETVAWLVKKAAEQETWDAAVLASKVDRGAVRIFLGTGHYRDAMDEHRAEVLREAAAELDRIADTVEARVAEHYGPASGIGPGSAQMLRDAAGNVRYMAGKDTEDGILPPVGESTQPEPDLHSIVLDALSAGQGPLLPLPINTARLLAEHVTDAVAPLVPYRPVWDASLPPGGYVCSICGDPVESEPCPEHAPRTEQHWASIADSLNALAAAGTHVGIAIDGVLTDHLTRAVIWDRDTERWLVACSECDRQILACGHCTECDRCLACGTCSGAGCSCNCETAQVEAGEAR